MANKQPVWSIILPTLNEGQALPALLESITTLPLSKRAEILIVDGGSTDGTHDAFLQAQARHPNLFWVDAPSGKSLALRIGFSRAKGRFIAFMDADGQYAPQALASVCRCLENGADLVVTCRRDPHADPLRRGLSLAFARLVGRHLLHLSAHDPQSGLKAIRADLLSRLHLRARYWDLDAQLIDQAARKGAQIKEV